MRAWGEEDIPVSDRVVCAERFEPPSSSSVAAASFAARGDHLAGLVSSDSQQRAASLRAVEALFKGTHVALEELVSREQEFIEALLECAVLEGPSGSVPGLVGRCLCRYGLRFSSFRAVWETVLAHPSPSQPVQRLQAFVQVVYEIVSAAAEFQASRETGAAREDAQHDGVLVGLDGHASDVLGACLEVLEAKSSLLLLPGMVKVFVVINEWAPADFHRCFQGVVELMLGGTVEPAMSGETRSAILESFSSFKTHWRAEENSVFVEDLQRRLLADIHDITLSAPARPVGVSGRLRALLRCFSGIATASGRLGELHDAAVPVLVRGADFCMRQLLVEPEEAVAGLRTCLCVHLACLEAAGCSAGAACVLEVLRSTTFRHLSVTPDPVARSLVSKIYLTLLLRCGPDAEQLVVDELSKELMGWQQHELTETARWLAPPPESAPGPPPQSQPLDERALHDSAAAPLLAFHFGVLRHSGRSLPALLQVLQGLPPSPGSGLLLAGVLDAARHRAEPGALESVGAPLWRVLGGLEGRAARGAVCRSSAAVWRCLGREAQLALLQGGLAAAGSLDVAAALCPVVGGHGLGGAARAAAAAYVAALQGRLPELLDVAGTGGEGSGDQLRTEQGSSAEWCLQARARLLALASAAVPPPGGLPPAAAAEPEAVCAAHLRGLLPAASPLGPSALVSLLTSLRTLENQAHIAALFWTSTASPQDVPPVCRPLWLMLQAAAAFVNHRLRSSFGSASSSLQFLETLLVDSSSAVREGVQGFLHTSRHRGVATASALAHQLVENSYRPLACAQLVHGLEQLVLLAREPVQVQPVHSQAELHSKSTCQFFEANHRVCGDWFQRMRGVLRQTLAQHGSHAALYAVSLARLGDVLRQHVPEAERRGLPPSLLLLASRPQQWRRKWGAPGGSSAVPERDELPLLAGEVPPEGPAAQDPLPQGRPPEACAPVEHALAPLLSSALALRSAELCRGALALHGHAAHLLGGAGPPPCQDALLAFAGQRYEEAAALFSARLGGGADGGPSAGGGGKTPAMQALVARTWLDAAVQSHDASAVEAWLAAYEGSPRVSGALRAFATAYVCLLQRDFDGCSEAVGAAKEGAVQDWAPAGVGSERGAHVHEAVAGLSRWSDLGSIYLVEASMAARSPSVGSLDVAGGADRALRALGDARVCLQADIAARAHMEPCLSLHGPDAYEPNSATLELVATAEAALLASPTGALGREHGAQAGSLSELHCAAVFDLPLFDSEADRLRLARHCVRLRSFKLAGMLLGDGAAGDGRRQPGSAAEGSVQVSIHRSMILEGQQRAPEAFLVVHEALLSLLGSAVQRQSSARSAAAADAINPGLPWLGPLLLQMTSVEGLHGWSESNGPAVLLARYAKLLCNHGSEIAQGWPQAASERSLPTFCEAAGETVRLLAGMQGGMAACLLERSPFGQVAERGHSDPEKALAEALLADTGSSTPGSGPVSQRFLGWLSLQGCLLCPSSAKLWARYGDWLFSQRAAANAARLDQAIAVALEPSAAAPGHEDLRVLRRCVREAVRRWMRPAASFRDPPGSPARAAERRAPITPEWLAERTRVGSCGLWQGLGAQEQQALAASLAELCRGLLDWEAVATAECVHAYSMHLSLGETTAPHPRRQRTVLRILRVLAHRPEVCASARVRELLLGAGQAPPLVPTGVWEPLVPQLLAYAQHPTREVAALSFELFASVARAAPHAAVFPALAAEPAGPVGQRELEASAPQAASAMQAVLGLYPEQLRGSELFARTLNMMATPVDEICARLLQFAETFVVARSGAAAVDCMEVVISKFASLLETLDAAVGEDRCGIPSTSAAGFADQQESSPEADSDKSAASAEAPGSEMLCVMGVQPCLSTPYSRRFLSTLLPALRRMVFLHRPYLTVPLTDGAAAELQKSLLSHLRLLLRMCAQFCRVSFVTLQDLAPDLIEMFQPGPDGQRLEVVLPIQAAPSATDLLRVQRVLPKVHMLSTKTKPKKLEFQAPDGTDHAFLLKGRDDLRLDGRIMQLLQAINSIVAADQGASLDAVRGLPAPAGPPIQLRCRDYGVVPIAPRAGIIRWVSAVPLFVIHRQRRHFVQEQQAERDGGGQRRLQESSVDLWHRKMRQNLQDAGVDMDKTPRRSWPTEALQKTFVEMQADSPTDIISRELFLSALHPAQHFHRCAAYASSVALMSVIGHLIGLGDRHLDNLLLDFATGEVVHVDYSICFDRGQRLRVPERVPFRLTRCMVSALGPMGVSGKFLQTMEVGLGLLREWRELVLSLSEPCFFLAPVNDWVHPISSPFKEAKAAGASIRRLCKTLAALDGCLPTAVTRVTDLLETYVVQREVVDNARARHSGLKVTMSREVRGLVDLERRKVEAVEQAPPLEHRLEELRAEECAVQDVLDMKISQLQSHSAGSVASSLDRQRRGLCLLLDPRGEGLAEGEAGPAAQAHHGLLQLLDLDGPGEDQGTPLGEALRAGARALGGGTRRQLRGLAGGPVRGAAGLPGGPRDTVLPEEGQDELCAFGLLSPGLPAQWLPAGASGGGASAAGVSVEGSVATLPCTAESLAGLVPAWSREAAAERALRALRAELGALDVAAAPGGLDGARGRAGRAARRGARGRARGGRGRAAGRRGQGAAAPGRGRRGGARLRRGPEEARCRGVRVQLRGGGRPPGEVRQLSRSKTSEFSVSACVSQAMDLGYPGATQAPNAQAQEIFLGVPLHGRLACLCARVSQVVQILLQANVIDFSHSLAVLAHHWEEVAQLVLDAEAAAVPPPPPLAAKEPEDEDEDRRRGGGGAGRRGGGGGHRDREHAPLRRRGARRRAGGARRRRARGRGGRKDLGRSRWKRGSWRRTRRRWTGHPASRRWMRGGIRARPRCTRARRRTRPRPRRRRTGRARGRPGRPRRCTPRGSSISRKIPRANVRLDLHAEALVAAATSTEDLAQMYEGWTAWI
ncbi:unnamed protein product [Prorocentrum cordatum]|uniref:non-specific serine/threonine protein kinase n=1 Tax=Prorocentrum cordatum TaxID=2364126 RepID=A0ABN9UAS6_9DINO|nr:unnamed protein product [Polarella glacialis]